MTVDGPLSESTADTDRAASDSELRPHSMTCYADTIRISGGSSGWKARPCDDRTSFNLVDLEIELEDGSVLRLLLKDLGRENLHETARRVKPDFLYNPLREIRTYRGDPGSEPTWHGAFLWGGRQSRTRIATGSSWKRSRA